MRVLLSAIVVALASLSWGSAAAGTDDTATGPSEKALTIRSATFPRHGWWTVGMNTDGSAVQVRFGSSTLEMCPVSGDPNDQRIGFPRRVGFESCVRPDSSGQVTLPATAAMFNQDGTFSYAFAVRTTGLKQEADLTISYQGTKSRLQCHPTERSHWRVLVHAREQHGRRVCLSTS